MTPPTPAQLIAEARNASSGHEAMSNFATAELFTQLADALTAALQERDEYRAVACDFHDALVGKDMAGMFNQRLCGRAVDALDVLLARDGRMPQEDIDYIREKHTGALVKAEELEEKLTVALQQAEELQRAATVVACAREVMRHADDSAAYLSVQCTCGRCPTKLDHDAEYWRAYASSAHDSSVQLLDDYSAAIRRAKLEMLDEVEKEFTANYPLPVNDDGSMQAHICGVVRVAVSSTLSRLREQLR